ncbi:hypothetical protein [Streptomyces anulatus]|uniref:hypothetical protein n=1 Tax=Streptomyces anulatus TaxID=1892 RepID=UPI0036660D0F
MLPEIAAEVSTGAAVALAAGAATSGAVWAKAKVRELMHRGTAAEQNEAVAVFDNAEATTEELAARVAPLLRVHLDSYPVAVNEFRALTIGGTTIHNQSNTGAGVFIGGDNHGGLTINQAGPAT